MLKGYETGLGTGPIPQVRAPSSASRSPFYSMAQAARRWQRTLFPYLLRQGFTATESDPCCVFIRRETVQTPSGPREERPSSSAATSTTSSPSTRTTTSTPSTFSFTERLTADWKVEDEGPISDLLNIEITQTKGSKVKLAQNNYIKTLVAAHSPAGAVTPFPPGIWMPTLCATVLPHHARHRRAQQ